MSQWVRTDYHLGVPMGVLTISNTDAARMGLSLPNLVDHGTPEEIEAVVYDLIEELRPELSGGALIGIKYELYQRRWEFTYLSRSMPKKSDGEEPERIPLIPE